MKSTEMETGSVLSGQVETNGGNDALNTPRKLKSTKMILEEEIQYTRK